jgi:hypothetical protein
MPVERRGLASDPGVTAGPPYVGWSLLIHIFLPVEMQLSRPLSTVTNNRTNCLSDPYAECPFPKRGRGQDPPSDFKSSIPKGAGHELVMFSRRETA